MRRIKEKIFNRKTIDTKHSIEQSFNRYYRNTDLWDKFKNELEFVIQKAKNKIVYEYNDVSDIYVVHSKSTGIGLSIDWREDTVFPDGLNHAIIITVLPRKKIHFKKNPSDVMLNVESQLSFWAREYIKEKRDIRVLESRYICNCDRAEIKLTEKYYHLHNKFMVSLVNGKFNHVNAEIIIVS